ncbi:MAG: PLP-dependent cysteine synthase family protein [Clostridium butyricum]|nr:PLP-dependent cysteine synthase family protein [Clostridium butyricum]
MINVIEKFNQLDHLIGNTPLIEINFKYKDRPAKIYSKLEYYNYTGSIKDRIALYILRKSYIKKSFKDNDIIIEATSGNTGISLAALGTYLNHEVHIYMPDWLSSERMKLLESFNAKLHLISKNDGGFKKCISITKELSRKNENIFLPNQFSNEDNILAHYTSTGPEILSTLKKHNIIPSSFIAGVGTGGTVMGIGKYLKDNLNNMKIYPLEPLNSPTLSTGKCINSHRIQGISDEFVPPILNLNDLDNIVSVDDGDSIIMAQKLSKVLGLGVGISSGANFLGAVKILEQNNFQGNIVTVFSDDNKKYLSTDLMKKEPVKDNFISTNIELLDLNVL